MQQQIDLNQLSIDQCKALAYDTICKINFLQNQLQGIEQHIVQRQQQPEADKLKEKAE